MSAISGRISLNNRHVITDRQVIMGRSASISRTGGAMSWAGQNLLAYYRADLENITITSGKISQWRDISGNNKHMSQSLGSRRPLFNSSAINGQPGILFSGSNVLSGSRIQSATNPLTIGGVFQATSLSGGKGIFAPSIIGGVQFDINVNGTGKREFRTNGVSQSNDGNATLNPEVWIVTGIASPASTTTYTFFIGTNKTQQTLTPSIVGNITPSGSTSLIGAMTTLSVSGFSGNICELFFMNKILSSQEIIIYLSYVLEKYGEL